MTADDRIEILLNRFGQTISDLPKPTKDSAAYGGQHYVPLIDAAEDFDPYHKRNPELMNFVIAQYAMHLADIIDRMENALMTATRIANCDYCEEKRCNVCGVETLGFRIHDYNLFYEHGIDDEEE